MFEIIMLFAFLYAATCQLLPEKTVTTGAPLPKKSRPDRKEPSSSRPLVQRHQSKRKSPAKEKSRSHSYAHAA